MAQNQRSHLHRYHPFAKPMGQRIFPFAFNGLEAAVLVVIELDIYLRILQFLGDAMDRRQNKS